MVDENIVCALILPDCVYILLLCRILIQINAGLWEQAQNRLVRGLGEADFTDLSAELSTAVSVTQTE